MTTMREVAKQLTNIRHEFLKLKDIQDVDTKASRLHSLITNGIISEQLEDYASDAAESIVSHQYIRCEIANIMDHPKMMLALGLLISGISNWEASWFWENELGVIEDLTHDKLDGVIDNILTQIPEDVQ